MNNYEVISDKVLHQIKKIDTLIRDSDAKKRTGNMNYYNYGYGLDEVSDLFGETPTDKSEASYYKNVIQLSEEEIQDLLEERTLLSIILEIIDYYGINGENYYDIVDEKEEELSNFEPDTVQYGHISEELQDLKEVEYYI